MRRIIILLISAITALGMIQAQAAGQVTLRGVVSDSDGEPLAGVSVRASSGAAGATRADGSYRITADVPGDSLTVRYTLLGYATVERALFRPHGELTLNIRMDEEDHELDEVVVNDIRKRTDAMERIDARGYSRLSAGPAGGSVESMISTMPGVSGVNELSNTYSVRGGAYDENAVYINGVEIYRPLTITSSSQEGLSMINPDMVGSVEFSTGGFGAQYGDRMSSVLDINYRRPAAAEGTVSASLMGGSAAFGHGGARFSQLHGVRYKRNASLLGSTDTKGEYDPDFFDWQSMLTYSPSARVQMSALINVNLSNYRFAPTDRETTFGTMNDAKRFRVYFDGQEKDRFNVFTGAFTVDWRAAERTTLTLQASGVRSDELVAYDISGEYWLDMAGSDDASVGGELGVGRYGEHARDRLRTTVYGATLRGATDIGRNRLTYGVSVRREEITEHAREWERRDSAGFSLPATGDGLRVWYASASDHELASTRGSVYLQDNLRLTPAAGFVNINFGVRGSWWSYNKETIICPRVQLGFVPARAPHWAFRFATGLYYQSPFYRELLRPVEIGRGEYVTAMNPDIKSQRSYQAILGTDFTFNAFGRPMKLSAEVYYKALSNLIAYRNDNLRPIYSGVNDGSGHVAGIDMRLFGQFVPGSDSWISLGLMNSSETVGGIKMPRPNDRRYNLSLYFTDFIPGIERLKVSLRGVLMDGLPTTPPRTDRREDYFRMPAYKRVDIGATYGIIVPQQSNRPSWLRGLWLGLDVFNLFDMDNVADYYWVTDVNSIQYAVPNYLTRRQVNVKLTLDF